MSERILVATDFSERADFAVKEASARAKELSAPFAVCHVVPTLVQPHTFFPASAESPERDAAAFDHRVFRALEENVYKLTGRDSTSVDLFVDVGTPYTEIVHRAETYRATRLVLSSRGRVGLERMLLGSVAEQVVRYAHCTVEVVRPWHSHGAVIAATDLSEPSLSALEVAAQEATRIGQPLLACFAIDFGTTAALGGIGTVFGAPPILPSTADADQIRSAAKSVLENAIQRFGAKGEAIVLEGPPAASICHLAEARDAERIVVATHGRTGLSRVALGSVAETIVRHAPCSVVAVRRHS